mmetsp:Transcript_28615/g.53636  ORF Transcript_28615/g.53636 Transcript_28615/m.53636 type:complete len:98 (-) Transcript_28615:110-403(-)|eukprot:CAMPEP_0170178034 /NCGR_PEP_ID=MMETSP0040_2-20121228/11626_1 /TAXON_ID=641309 /ORGANISM="Lotharella oceanica, Strain CCMP622" /LENGTH=97 /DNA_ID=CAMNT_0010420983 /DNA_START=133 /DNA_END=426 /DNA_ORIENTATION=-
MNFVKQGMPMLAFMALGSYGLSKMMTGKYISEEAKMTEAAARDNFDLDKELEKMKCELDLDNWENKRIPRPDEAGGDLIGKSDKHVVKFGKSNDDDR